MNRQRAFFGQIPQLAQGEMGLFTGGKYDGDIRIHFAPYFGSMAWATVARADATAALRLWVALWTLSNIAV